jgi:hypothetical protein
LKYSNCIKTELVDTDILKSIAQVATKLKAHEDVIPIDENLFVFKFRYKSSDRFSSIGSKTRGLLVTVFKKILSTTGITYQTVLQLKLGYPVNTRSFIGCRPVYEVGFSYGWEHSNYYLENFYKVEAEQKAAMDEVLACMKAKISPETLRKILYKPYKKDESPCFRVWV